MKLWIDLETYSETPIRNGTYRYAADAEIILFAWAIDDEEVDVWDPMAGGSMPDRLRDALNDPSVTIAAHESFDRIVLNATGVISNVPTERWWDTAAQARAHSLPGGLEKLCRILGVPTSQSKMPGGKDLVRFFTQPKKGKRATAETHPEKWDLFKDYCALDVVAMREVYRRLPTWNYGDQHYGLQGRAQWILDQEMNDRGIHVDTQLARGAVAAGKRVRERLNDRVQVLTWDEITSAPTVEKATQRDKLLAHLLQEFGVSLPDMQSATIEKRLEDEDLPDVVKELLAIRLQTAGASISKYESLLRSVTDDERLHGTILYRGALRTGRRSGRIFQPQNLARVPKHFPGSTRKAKDEYDEVAEIIRLGAGDLLLADPLETMGYLVRGAITAAPGHILHSADLSNIEGRMMAWLAGEDWKLKAFEEVDAGKGHDLYVLSYANAFHEDPDAVQRDVEAGGIKRQVGKVMELAFQYWGALGAFKKMMTLYGLDLPDERIVQVVKAWRAVNRATMNFSGEIEKATRAAIMNPGQAYIVRAIRVRRDGNWLRVRLPSGRVLVYPRPQVDEDGVISYMGVNAYTRQWTRIDTYGGKMGENIVQAASGDVMFENELEFIEPAGYKLVLDVHDEPIAETLDNGQYSGQAMAALLKSPRPWAPGLPLAAGGYSTYRYRKG